MSSSYPKADQKADQKRVVRLKRGNMRSAHATLESLVSNWELSMRARNLADNSIRSYTKHVRRFMGWLGVQEDGSAWTVGDVSKPQIERYLAESLANGGKAKSVSVYHGALLVFLRWCVGEGEIERNPMEGVRAPIVPESLPPVLTDDELRALLATCEGPGFYDRRNTAILRLFIDTGIRRSEMAGLTVADLDLKLCEAHVHRKFRREGIVAFKSKCAQAIGRYLRVREQHPDASEPWLWLGRLGQFTGPGIYTMVRVAGQEAGIPAWPHKLRHVWAHGWLAEGGQEGSLMENAGWRTRSMIQRYGGALRAERARDEARRMQLGDRI